MRFVARPQARLDAAQESLGKLTSAAYNVGSFNAFREAGYGQGVKPKRAAAMFATLAPMMAETVQKLLEKKDSEFTFKTITGLPGVGGFTGYQSCLDPGYWNAVRRRPLRSCRAFLGLRVSVRAVGVQ